MQRSFWSRWDAEIASALACVLAALLVWMLSGCQAAKSAGGEVGGVLAEYIACPVIPGLDCGHVFMCAAVADNALGHVEICVDDDDQPEQLAAVEDLYGACDLTPRHQGLCLYCCGPDCGRGGNAYSGTWCP